MESEKKLRSAPVIVSYRFIDFTGKNLHRNYFMTQRYVDNRWRGCQAGKICEQTSSESDITVKQASLGTSNSMGGIFPRHSQDVIAPTVKAYLSYKKKIPKFFNF